MPSKIEQAHGEFKDRGLTVLAINIGEQTATVADWVREKGLSFTVLPDPTGAVTQAYKVVATPTVYLVGRDGRLVGKAIGPKDWDTETGKAALRALVNH